MSPLTGVRLPPEWNARAAPYSSSPSTDQSLLRPIKNKLLSSILDYKFQNNPTLVPVFDVDAAAFELHDASLLWTLPSLRCQLVSFSERNHICDRSRSNLITSGHSLIINYPIHMYIKKDLILKVHLELLRNDMILGKLNEFGCDVAFSGVNSIPTSALIVCLNQKDLGCDSIVVVDASRRHPISPIVRWNGSWFFDHSTDDMGGRIVDWLTQDNGKPPSQNRISVELIDIAQTGKFGENEQVLVHKVVPELIKVNSSSVRIHPIFSEPKDKVGNVDFNKMSLRKLMLNASGAAKKKADVVNPVNAAEVKRLNDSAFNDSWNVHTNRQEGLGWDQPVGRKRREFEEDEDYCIVKSGKRIAKEDMGIEFTEDEDVIDDDDFQMDTVSPKHFDVVDLSGLLFTKLNAPFLFNNEEYVSNGADLTSGDLQMKMIRNKIEAIAKGLASGKLSPDIVRRKITEALKHCFPSVKLYNPAYHPTRILKPDAFKGSAVDFTNKSLKVTAIDVLKQTGFINRNSNLPEAIEEVFMRMAIGDMNVVSAVNSTIDFNAINPTVADDAESDDDVEEEIPCISRVPAKNVNDYFPRTESGCALMFLKANEYRLEITFYTGNNTGFGAVLGKCRSLEEMIVISLILEHCNILGVEQVLLSGATLTRKLDVTATLLLSRCMGDNNYSATLNNNIPSSRRVTTSEFGNSQTGALVHLVKDFLGIGEGIKFFHVQLHREVNQIVHARYLAENKIVSFYKKSDGENDDDASDFFPVTISDVSRSLNEDGFLDRNELKKMVPPINFFTTAQFNRKQLEKNETLSAIELEKVKVRNVRLRNIKLLETTLISFCENHMVEGGNSRPPCLIPKFKCNPLINSSNANSNIGNWKRDGEIYKQCEEPKDNHQNMLHSFVVCHLKCLIMDHQYDTAKVEDCQQLLRKVVDDVRGHYLMSPCNDYRCIGCNDIIQQRLLHDMFIHAHIVTVKSMYCLMATPGSVTINSNGSGAPLGPFIPNQICSHFLGSTTNDKWSCSSPNDLLRLLSQCCSLLHLYCSEYRKGNGEMSKAVMRGLRLQSIKHLDMTGSCYKQFIQLRESPRKWNVDSNEDVTPVVSSVVNWRKMRIIIDERVPLSKYGDIIEELASCLDPAEEHVTSPQKKKKLSPKTAIFKNSLSIEGTYNELPSDCDSIDSIFVDSEGDFEEDFAMDDNAGDTYVSGCIETQRITMSPMRK